MPKLLLFAPSVKAIVDQADNTMSLISILDTVSAELPAEELPENAATPISWAISTLWYEEHPNSEREFEQKVRLIDPNGQPIGNENSLAFFMSERLKRLILLGHGFPVASEGEYQAQLLLRDRTSQTEFEMIAEYPILVRHIQPAVPTE